MATNPYSSQSASGYNSSPPPDGGEETEANRVKWSTIRTKLSDVLKTFAEAIDSAVSSAFSKVINTDSNENNAMAGSLAFTSSELTIASGSVAATRSQHTIDTESDAASDDLANITTGSVTDGCVLYLSAANTARTVVVKHEATGAGQIHLAGGQDVILDDTNKSLVLIRRGTDWYELKSPGGIVLATEQATTSGTEIDFTGIPPGTKRITVMLFGVSTTGTSEILLQIGDSGGVETSAYVSNVTLLLTTTLATDNSTAGFLVSDANAAGSTYHGKIELVLENSATFTWVSGMNMTRSDGSRVLTGAGSKSLSAELDRIRLTTVGGSDTFDAGVMNIQYE